MPPVIYTPLTKFMHGMYSQQRGKCADFEMDFYRCASRVGYQRSKTDCHKELDDYIECVSQMKQFERYVIMQKERKKIGRPCTPVPPGDIAGVY